jgi:AcrR family transcriptional regulator
MENPRRAVRTSKPSFSERRARILIAAAPLFHEHGLEGTRVRQIATAAGVSEALLYQHFPTKEALYAEIQAQWKVLATDPEYLAIQAMEPSSEKLAIMLVTTFRRYLTDGLTPGFGSTSDRTRVFLNSLADAGQFARSTLQTEAAAGGSLVEACFAMAEAAGECHVQGSYRTAWLCIEQIRMMLAALRVSGNDDLFDQDAEGTIRQVSLFCLRGVGMTERTIERVLGPAMAFDRKYRGG